MSHAAGRERLSIQLEPAARRLFLLSATGRQRRDVCTSRLKLTVRSGRPGGLWCICWHSDPFPHTAERERESTEGPLEPAPSLPACLFQVHHLVAGDLVQWPRPSVADHVILLDGRGRIVLRPLAGAGVGQLDERE